MTFWNICPISRQAWVEAREPVLSLARESLDRVPLRGPRGGHYRFVRVLSEDIDDAPDTYYFTRDVVVLRRQVEGKYVRPGAES